MELQLVVLAAIFQLAIGQFTLAPGLGYYKVFLDKMPWKDALDACKQHDANISSVNSVAEKEYIMKLIYETVGESDSAFIGFIGNVNESSWTVEGKLIPKEEVKIDKSISDFNRCGKMSASGDMILSSCSKSLPYVCKIPLWRSYELIPNMGYYKLFQEGRTWSEARRRCEQDGAYLAIVDNSQELDALLRILARHPVLPLAENSMYVATGARKVMQYDKYVTVHGDDYSPYGITFNAQFTTHPYECLFIARSSSKSLQVQSCQTKQAFICEMHVTKL